jgi:hypothetical protein
MNFSISRPGVIRRKDYQGNNNITSGCLKIQISPIITAGCRGDPALFPCFGKGRPYDFGIKLDIFFFLDNLYVIRYMKIHSRDIKRISAFPKIVD